MLQGNYNWAEQVLAAAASGGSDIAFYVTCQVAGVICFSTGTGYASNAVPNLLEVDKLLQVCCQNLLLIYWVRCLSLLFDDILLLKFVTQVFHFLVLNRSSHFLPCRTAIRNQTFAAPTAHQQPQQRPAEPPPQPHLCRLPPARGTRIAWRHKIVAMAKSAPSTMSRSRG